MPWITKDVDVVLHASVVLHIFRRADHFPVDGRFDRQGTAVTIRGAGSSPARLRLAPQARASFAWQDAPDGRRTIWRLARLSWDPASTSESAVWQTLEILAERPLRPVALESTDSERLPPRLLRELRALEAVDFAESTRRFLGGPLRARLKQAGYGEAVEAGEVTAGRLALELTWGVIDEAKATEAWVRFLRIHARSIEARLAVAVTAGRRAREEREGVRLATVDLEGRTANPAR